MEMLHPMPLRPGDAVCFCTPSLPIVPNRKERIDRRQACVEWAAALELKPVFAPNFARHTEVYSHESRKMRVDDFNFALDHPMVSIVGGGGGAISLLDGIDYGKARRNRPVVMGMSDQTKIVNAIAARAGLVTYYGPNGGFGHWYQADGNPKKDFFTQKTLEEIHSALWDRKAHLAPTGGEEDAAWKPLELRVEKFGCADVLEGMTFGGHWNAAAQTMSGTEYFLRAKGKKLIFLEALHDVVLNNFIAFERMRIMGYWRDAAVLCGGPFWEKPGEAVRQGLIDYCARHGIPLVYHLRFGHFHPISVLPVGAQARIDTRKLELTWSAG